MIGTGQIRRLVVIEFGTPGASGDRYADLRVNFRVERARGSSPTTAKITVYNLDAQAVSLLRTPGTLVRLYAGHDDGSYAVGSEGVETGAARQIFQGTPIHGGVSDAGTVGVEGITKIEALDGAGWATGRVAVSYRSVTWATLFTDATAALGLPLGGARPSFVHTWRSPFHYEGPASDLLDRLARIAGMHWRIIDGVVFFAPSQTPLGPTGDRGPLYAPEFGTLIGDVEHVHAPLPTPPPIGSAKATSTKPPKIIEGTVKLKTLLDPSMRPGRRFRLAEGGLDGTIGTYIAREVAFVGDSGWDAAFYTEITATPDEG